MKKINKTNKEKKKIINYYSFLKPNNDNTTFKQELINKEFYINIDSKNYLEKESQKELKIIKERIENFKELKSNSNKEEISKQELTKKITKKFLDKLYPQCDADARKISLLISQEIKPIKKLTKDKVEVYINYFYSLRHDIKYSRTLRLTKEVFRNIGYILCYIYQKYIQFSMKGSSGKKECVKKIIEKNIDVLTDYFLYCQNNGLDPIQTKKTKVWKNLRKSYEMPPEFIFLINMFHRINSLDINIDFEGETLEPEDIKLFTITILNINFFLPKLEHANLNFVHNKLQFYLYKRYYIKIFNLLKIGEENIKKNIIKDHSSIYNIKWDFEQNFNLEEYKKNKLYIVKDGIIYDDYSILCCIENNDLTIETGGKRRIFNSLAFSSIFNSTDNLIKVEKKDKSKQNNKNKETAKRYDSILDKNYDCFEVISDEENDKLSNKTSSTKVKNEKDNKNKKNKKNKNSNHKSQYVQLLEKNAPIFDIMLMTICGITRIESIKKLNLLSNDFYNKDLINYMIKFYELDVASIDDEYHVLDMFYNKTKNLDLLNIEINSLDIVSFDKIIGIIYKNKSLNSLKLSFFSSDVSYLSITLLKVYEQIKTNEDIAQYVINKGKNLTLENFEKKIVKDISSFFIDNLYLLFEIIKNNNNLEEIGLNFDLPSILIDNINYKIPIFKFILNLIFLIDNNENQNKNKIKTLTLLSPYTIFDNRFENEIDLIFKDITIYKNTKSLKELNVQFKFYNMIYLKNLISPNLIELSIGDLDLISFDKLVNYLSSFDFSNKSVLNKLNIKIMNTITSFNTDIKIILRKLFNIKINTFLELKLFTNIILHNKLNYSYLIKIINNNWIPSYTIILNEESKKIIYNADPFGEEILFLVSPKIEYILFKQGKIKGKIIENNNKEDNNEIFWILKYLFICKYSNDSLSFLEIKKLIFTILKYLYLTSNVKVTHQIEDEEKDLQDINL